MVTVSNLTRACVLADRAEIATSAKQRMIGLLSRRTFEAGEALIFPQCNAIHTYFMRFSIDVVFLDAHGIVVKMVEDLNPFHLAWAPHAQMTIELPAGTVQKSQSHIGEVLVIT